MGAIGLGRCIWGEWAAPGGGVEGHFYTDGGCWRGQSQGPGPGLEDAGLGVGWRWDGDGMGGCSPPPARCPLPTHPDGGFLPFSPLRRPVPLSLPPSLLPSLHPSLHPSFPPSSKASASASPPGSWSWRGCRTVPLDSSRTKCLCDRFSSFAILAQLSPDMVSESRRLCRGGRRSWEREKGGGEMEKGLGGTRENKRRRDGDTAGASSVPTGGQSRALLQSGVTGTVGTRREALHHLPPSHRCPSSPLPHNPHCNFRGGVTQTHIPGLLLNCFPPPFLPSLRPCA